MQGLLDYLQAHAALILGVLLGVSEALAAIPAVKANSVFQVLVSLLAKLAGKQPPAA